jgi:hypothetical protein
MQSEILNGPDSTHIQQRGIPILSNIPPWYEKTTETTVKSTAQARKINTEQSTR